MATVSVDMDDKLWKRLLSAARISPSMYGPPYVPQHVADETQDAYMIVANRLNHPKP